MFISMQNNNFIPQFFLEILQRHCILVILSTLSMPGHTLSRVTVLIYRKLWWSLCKKSISSLTSFLGYCKDFANFLFWVIWAALAMPTKINGINLYDSLMFICMQEINFIPPFFFEILQWYYNLLFWVLWACLAMTIKNDNTSL